MAIPSKGSLGIFWKLGDRLGEAARELACQSAEALSEIFLGFNLGKGVDVVARNGSEGDESSRILFFFGFKVVFVKEMRI